MRPDRVEAASSAARELVGIDATDPEEFRRLRHAAGLRLLEKGFSRLQVETLFGDVLADSPDADDRDTAGLAAP